MDLAGIDEWEESERELAVGEGRRWNKQGEWEKNERDNVGRVRRTRDDVAG